MGFGDQLNLQILIHESLGYFQRFCTRRNPRAPYLRRAQSISEKRRELVRQLPVSRKAVVLFGAEREAEQELFVIGRAGLIQL